MSSETIINLLHEGRYWKFSFSDVQPKQIHLIFERFMDPISHVAIRFHLKSPLELRSLDDKDTAMITDLIFSPEAAVPVGEKLKLFPSLQGEYVFVHRLLSLEAAKDWMVLVQKHKVDQFSIEMGEQSVLKLFSKVIQLATDEKQNQNYFLLNKNCSTTIADLLVEEKLSAFELVSRVIPVPMNFGLLNFLKGRNLVNFTKTDQHLKL